MVTNAFLVTNEEKYRDWVVEYTDAWIQRGKENGGLIPDNVGLSGQVGEYCNGKWYGGLYGWTWPHGFSNMIAALFDAGTNAFLLTRDADYLDLPRSQIDGLLELGEMRSPDQCDPMGPVKREASSERKEDQIFISQCKQTCLLYTSPSPRDGLLSRMPSSA